MASLEKKKQQMTLQYNDNLVRKKNVNFMECQRFYSGLNHIPEGQHIIQLTCQMQSQKTTVLYCIYVVTNTVANITTYQCHQCGRSPWSTPNTYSDCLIMNSGLVQDRFPHNYLSEKNPKAASVQQLCRGNVCRSPPLASLATCVRLQREVEPETKRVSRQKHIPQLLGRLKAKCHIFLTLQVSEDDVGGRWHL